LSRACGDLDFEAIEVGLPVLNLGDQAERDQLDLVAQDFPQAFVLLDAVSGNLSCNIGRTPFLLFARPCLSICIHQHQQLVIEFIVILLVDKIVVIVQYRDFRGSNDPGGLAGRKIRLSMTISLASTA
jgi:hypothetical protein